MHFDDEDYVKVHAAFQSEIKCMDKNEPLIQNLLGPGEEVLDFALNDDVTDPDYLHQLYEEKLKTVPESKEVDAIETDDNQEGESWHSSITRTVPYLEL